MEDNQQQLDDLDEEDNELKCNLALGFPQHDHRIGEVANHRGGHEEQEPLPKGGISACKYLAASKGN